jgi:hypothetical protein
MKIGAWEKVCRCDSEPEVDRLVVGERKILETVILANPTPDDQSDENESKRGTV